SIPLVILINKYSASASEIVAGCLQDHGRAIVMGERSWGKGTVQNLFELEGGRSALKLTTATYWRPSNKNIHRRENAPENEDWGVRPNEGYEMVLTDDQWKELYAARRERDTGRRNPQASPDVDQPVDPHVQRAREYHEAKL
ncbi:MAG: S41 family peptidase, partial [Pirellulaceae bacterium]